MKKLLILKLGSTLPRIVTRRGDMEDWFMAGLGLDASQVQVFDPRRNADFPPVDQLAGVLMTGSHDMVTERLDWSEQTAGWVRKAVETGLPTLGVCYGHQLLAHAFGGQVDNNPCGTQLGTTTIQLLPEGQADSLLGGLGTEFDAQVAHTQSVLTLPEGATRLAFDDWDANQSFRIGQTAWGVQFHPEMDANIVHTYLQAEKAFLKTKGQDPEKMLATVRETPVAAQLLPKFARLLLEKTFS
jgi:GMP synthase (glutamine-hydrolysing)